MASTDQLQRAPESQPLQLLIVDDDPMSLRAVRRVFESDQFRVTAVAGAHEALELCRTTPFDVALVDLNMPGISGIDFLRSAKAERPGIEVVIMTAFGSIPSAVEAVKTGAFEYLTKPFDRPEHARHVVEGAARRRLVRGSMEVSTEVGLAHAWLGSGQLSPALSWALRRAGELSATGHVIPVVADNVEDATLVAQIAHERRQASGRSMVRVRCRELSPKDNTAAGPMVGSSVAAAAQQVRELLTSAVGGTVYFEDVLALSPLLQRTLVEHLHALGTGARKHDVQVVAWVSRDISDAIARGWLDAGWRVFEPRSVALSRLADRPSDMRFWLIRVFRAAASEAAKRIERVTEAALDALLRHPRVLDADFMRRAVTHAVESLSGEVVDVAEALHGVDLAQHTFDVSGTYRQAKRTAMNEFKLRYVAAALRRSGSIAGAARAAGVDRSNFRRLMKRNGLSASQILGRTKAATST